MSCLNKCLYYVIRMWYMYIYCLYRCLDTCWLYWWTIEKYTINKMCMFYLSICNVHAVSWKEWCIVNVRMDCIWVTIVLHLCCKVFWSVNCVYIVYNDWDIDPNSTLGPNSNSKLRVQTSNSFWLSLLPWKKFLIYKTWCYNHDTSVSRFISLLTNTT